MSRKNHEFLQRKKETRRRVRATRRREKRELAKQLSALEGEEIAYFDELAREAGEREFDRELALVSKDFERQLAPGFTSQEDEEVDDWGDDRALQAFCEEHSFG